MSSCLQSASQIHCLLRFHFRQDDTFGGSSLLKDVGSKAAAFSLSRSLTVSVANQLNGNYNQVLLIKHTWLDHQEVLPPVYKGISIDRFPELLLLIILGKVIKPLPVRKIIIIKWRTFKTVKQSTQGVGVPASWPQDQVVKCSDKLQRTLKLHPGIYRPLSTVNYSSWLHNYEKTGQLWISWYYGRVARKTHLSLQ